MQTINSLKEKSQEYNNLLCLAFVDYEKAFDSVETQAILGVLKDQGVDDGCIEVLKDTIYTDSKVSVNMHKNTKEFEI